MDEFELKIRTEGGELKYVRLREQDSHLITTYDTESDCMGCDRYRLISGQTVSCFECDHPQIVKDLKILLGLDHD